MHFINYHFYFYSVSFLNKALKQTYLSNYVTFIVRHKIKPCQFRDYQILYI